jgi:hypothetical protein
MLPVLPFIMTFLKYLSRRFAESLDGYGLLMNVTDGDFIGWSNSARRAASFQITCSSDREPIITDLAKSRSVRNFQARVFFSC